jgi:hypothetical protein
MVWSYNELLRQGDMTVRGLQNVWTALVRPYLEYGAEVWPSERDHLWPEAELIQRKMGKRILACSKRTPDEVVQGELGWMSLAGRRMMLRLFFWAKILRMGRDTWVRRVYSAGRRLVEALPGRPSWCRLTRTWLRQLGLGQYWDSQETPEITDWKDMVRSSVLRLEEERWLARMALKPKLSDYRRWKFSLEYEPYLESRDVVGRKALTRLRGCTHELRVETGRWERVTLDSVAHRPRRDERWCRQCYRETEDETHFLLRCPLYSSLRDALITQLEKSCQSALDRVHVFVMRREQALDAASVVDCHRTVAWLMADKTRVRLVLEFVRKAFTARRRIVGLSQQL